jgi:hypothetical protein
VFAATNSNPADDAAEYHGVQRLAFDWRRAPQQIQQDDAARGERERGCHVEHRQLAGAHHRLTQRLDVVRDRLDAGVGSAPERVGAQEQRQCGDPSDVVHELFRFGHRVRHDQRKTL